MLDETVYLLNMMGYQVMHAKPGRYTLAAMAASTHSAVEDLQR